VARSCSKRKKKQLRTSKTLKSRIYSNSKTWRFDNEKGSVGNGNRRISCGRGEGEGAYCSVLTFFA